MPSPQNVGIKAIELYLPSEYVEQDELEAHDEIPKGKYTIGLGQTRMAFVNDREDTYSMALTVLSQLIKKHNIDTSKIGRLEVGTETLLDKSKSAKSVLMQLFANNHDIEGIDTYNACYGGTSALFNSVNWVYSPSWDGRDAIVVAGDIAIYAKGAARPTGGAGMVAMLIGPDAPLVVNPVHGTYMEHAYDFYKPDFTSEYPVVDGQFSLTCYTKALDQSYRTYNRKAGNSTGIENFDFIAFHVPTCKLVTKCYARLLYNDYLANPSQFEGADISEHVKKLSYEASLTDREVEKTFLALAKTQSEKRMQPSLKASTNVGNIYTGSLYLSLASVLTFGEGSMAGKQIGMFSYGSGLAASFFKVSTSSDEAGLKKLIDSIDLKNKLETRTKRTPSEYESSIELRERAHLKSNYSPIGSIDHLRPGTYYLVNIDEKFRRSYAIKQ